MKNLTLSVLSNEHVIKTFNKDLIFLWTNTVINTSNIGHLLEKRQLVNIIKESAITYVEMLNLVNTKQDGEYIIDLIKYNLHNEESIGLLINALYFLWCTDEYSIVPTSEILLEGPNEGLNKVFDWILNDQKSTYSNQFCGIAEKYLL